MLILAAVELPLCVVVTILECCVTFSGVKLSIYKIVCFIYVTFVVKALIKRNTEMEPVPRPYPDVARLNELHYCSHKKTPKYDSDGNLRPVDDFQPGARLHQLFQENKITSNDEASINQFSLKHVVEEKLVLAYVKHLEMLKFERNKRSESRNKAKEKESMKEFSEFNWRNLFETGKLKKLNSKLLEKYTTHYNLGNFRYKKDLLDAIIAHICSSGSIVVQRKGTKQGNTTAFKTMDNGEKITSDSSSTLSESDESEDLVLAKFDSSDEESNSLESGNEISVKRAAAVHLFQVKSWDLCQSLGKIGKHPVEEQSEDLPNTLNFSNFYDFTTFLCL